MILSQDVLRALLMLPLIVEARYVMYLTGQHPQVPELSLVKDITHVALAFMQSSLFNEDVQEEPRTQWPLFTSVSETRKKFKTGTKIMVAIGGWGDTASFSGSADTVEGRRRFAKNVRRMVQNTGADGVDIDWEYPGGNGEDYKIIPNSEKSWEIEAYPLLLSEIRAALGPSKIISAAVPGLPRDMLAFTESSIPLISPSLDFFNVMTYDLMNRRDQVTKHHTGIQASLEAVDAYLARGVPADKINLGFAFYVKWFVTSPNGGCEEKPVGCETVVMEDPITGADLGKAGAFAWSDAVPSELEDSFRRAIKSGKIDAEGGGYYYWDSVENRWWSWDTEEVIAKKIPEIVERRGKQLGGVFAWGLGEDEEGGKWRHLRALSAGYRAYQQRRLGERDEL